MKTRKARTAAIGGVILGVVLGIMSHYLLVANAGDLEPSDPPGPTMKTLTEVEPRIPIPGCATPAALLEITEPGSYCLTGDRVASGAGIRIRSSNVTLDLMGYALTGPGKDAGGWAGIEIGYSSEHYDSVEVRNGTVRDFGFSNIYADSDVTAVRVIGIRAISGGRGIGVFGESTFVEDCITVKNGIGIMTGQYAHITGCTASENDGLGMQALGGSRVTECAANNNGGHGIEVWSQAEVIGNTAIGNGENGIDAGQGVLIVDNNASGNTLDGIYAHGGSVLKDNVASYNDDDGIETGDGCTLINNTVAHNSDYGIYAENGCTLIGNTGYGQENDYGIRGFHGSVMKNNAAYNNNRGIYAGEGSTVIGNTAYNNETWGIYVYQESLVDRNTAYNNVTGGGAETNLRADATCTVITNHAP